jgi:hypothetical protein
MPSTKDPNSVVNPGPGRLPADSVPASALLFVSGSGPGGSAAALQAHLTDPTDAHMASAIGIPTTYSATGEPLLFPAGGVIDGESVLDFINEFKDLIPAHPNPLGFNLPAGVNSGIPSWGTLNTPLYGGYANGTVTINTRFIVSNGTTGFAATGTVFPADRGVLALYSNTSGDFYDAANTTLVAALWLGNTPAPAGIPNAAFSESLRTGAQANHVASAVGLDLISLTFRLPYLTSYAAHPGAPYAGYAANFYRFQLATYAIATQSIAAGGAQNFLLVHWREGHATTLASIQPVNLTVLTHVLANCYSATPDLVNPPPAGTTIWDSSDVLNVNRHNVFRDVQSATLPLLGTSSTSVAGVPTFASISGVTHINDTGLQFFISISAQNLFSNSFQTNTSNHPPEVPVGFASAQVPMLLDFADFGGGLVRLGYFDLHAAGPNPNYSLTNAPQPGDFGAYTNTNLAIPTPVPFTPRSVGGVANIRYTFNSVFQTVGPNLESSKLYLFNSYPQTGGAGALSTDTYEPFVDEHYRYKSTYDPTVAAVPIVPAGLDAFDSTHVFVAGETDLQILGNYVKYPVQDFSTANHAPVGPDYSSLWLGDGTQRFYIRAFDTGVARNTGKIRLRGITPTHFQVDAPYDGNPLTGHMTGGLAIAVRVPGVTGWLDVGRPLGDPGVGFDPVLNSFYGCATSTITDGLGDVIVSFQTTAFTANNGSGKFPLFVIVAMVNNGVGRSTWLDEVEWLAP